MPSWDEIQDHMRGNYHLEDDAPDFVSMVWTYEDGRSQKIVVRQYVAYDRELVEFKSAFARLGDVEPAEMLRKNNELPFATIALAGNVYVVVYNALLENLHVDDFDFALSRVAAVADTLEEKYVIDDEF